MKHFFNGVLFFMSLSVCGQQANVWTFGGGGGGIDFNHTPPKSLQTMDLMASHGTASICDEQGRLVMYTDGVVLYNAKGDTITSGLLGGHQALQTGIFVPDNERKNIFYLFTTSSFTSIIPKSEGFHYSIIDMNLNNGKGGILKKNVKLHSNTSVKLTAVQSIDCGFSWVVTLAFDEGAFYVYRIDKNGVNATPVISKVGKHLNDVGWRSRGTIKISPDGSKLANCASGINEYSYLYYGWLELFDFDMGTGKVSNPVMIYDANNDKKEILGIESVAFSPNSKILYACQRGTKPLQIDLYSDKLEMRTFTDHVFRRIELGPGNKIYGILDESVSMDSLLNLNTYGKYISAIHNPDILGDSCNVEAKYIKLETGFTIFSLPNFPQSFFYNDSLQTDFSIKKNCFGEKTQFGLELNYPVVDYWWTFGDFAAGNDNTSDLENPEHYYNKPGEYEVLLHSIDICLRKDTVKRRIVVFPDPVFSIDFDTLQRCYSDVPYVLSLPNYQFTNYIINGDSAGFEAALSHRGAYNVELRNECYTQGDTFFYDLVPEIIPPLAADTFFCEGDAGILSARNDLAQYLWNTGADTREIEVYQEGEYTVSLHSACQTIEDKTNVKFIKADINSYLINVFTPNGDNINEGFQNYSVHSPNYRTRIFNRYGNVLFESTNPDALWDGRVNGIPTPSGVYFYLTEAMDCKAVPISIKGSFTLLK